MPGLPPDPGPARRLASHLPSTPARRDQQRADAARIFDARYAIGSWTRSRPCIARSRATVGGWSVRVGHGFGVHVGRQRRHAPPVVDSRRGAAAAGSERLGGARRPTCGRRRPSRSRPREELLVLRLRGVAHGRARLARKFCTITSCTCGSCRWTSDREQRLARSRERLTDADEDARRERDGEASGVLDRPSRTAGTLSGEPKWGPPRSASRSEDVSSIMPIEALHVLSSREFLVAHHAGLRCGSSLSPRSRIATARRLERRAVRRVVQPAPRRRTALRPSPSVKSASLQPIFRPAFRDRRRPVGA